MLDPAGPVPLRHIAAVTFTEKAGAELRDRLRAEFERAAAGGPDAVRAAALEALDELDAAAIGTLHSFARRILTEHPIEAALPPLIEVLDEVASGVTFDARYADLRTAILDDATLTPALLLALSAGMKLDDLRSIARSFTSNWDLIADRVLAGPVPVLLPVDVATVLADARALAATVVHCRDEEDLLLPHVQAAELTTSDHDRADLLERTGTLALRELRYEDARALFGEAIALYERMGATHPAARVMARLAEADYPEGRLDEAISRLDAAFEVLSGEQEDRDLAVLAAQLGRMRFFAGDIDRANDAVEVALRISEAEGLPDVISDAMNTRSIIMSSIGRYQEGIALLRHSLSLALEHDLPEPALRAYNNLAETATDLDRHEEGLEIYERGLALADRVGSGVWKRGLLSEIVFPLMMAGRWDEALERAAQVPDSQKSGADIIGLLVSIPVIDVARGDLAGAERILEIFEGYGRSSDVQQVAAYACANASVLRAHGKFLEALESARLAVAVAEQVGYTGTIKVGFTQGIGAAFSLGDLEAVRGFVRQIDEVKPGIELPFLRALADRTRARLAVIEGDEEAAERYFKTAIGLFRETGIPYWRALSQIEFAEALVTAGRADDASSLAQEARDTLDRLGASTWLERLDKLQLSTVPTS